MVVSFKSVFLKTLLTLQTLNCVAVGKNDYQCDVCRAVVREANWKVSLADPKKFVQVGSFRVDPNGNQNIKEKKYARSESHLEDIFESICGKMQDYSELTNADGTKEIVRSIGIDGKRLNTKDLNLDNDVRKKLRYQCDNFLENHEEVVMSHLQRENLEDYEQVICGQETGVCSGHQLSRPMTELPEAQDEELEMQEPEEEDENDEEEEESQRAEEEIPSTNDETENLSDTNEKEEL